MSDKDIKTNFNLSADFNEYIVNHPDITKDIPENACIVFVPKDNKKLASKNREMARDITRRQHRACFGAVKDGKKWSIKKIAFAK